MSLESGVQSLEFFYFLNANEVSNLTPDYRLKTADWSNKLLQ